MSFFTVLEHLPHITGANATVFCDLPPELCNDNVLRDRSTGRSVLPAGEALGHQLLPGETEALCRATEGPVSSFTHYFI